MNRRGQFSLGFFSLDTIGWVFVSGWACLSELFGFGFSFFVGYEGWCPFCLFAFRVAFFVRFLVR